MGDVLSDDAAAVLDLANGDPDPILAEMTSYGRERSFPIVGSAAGRTMRLLARTAGVRRIFEFGSGFGYSGAWFLDALPVDGELVLTDLDAENLETAADFLERFDHPATVRYEAGDALETFGAYEGPFDLVLLDHQKSRYVEALDLAIDALAPGALVVADNMLAGPVTPAGVRAALDGGPVPDDTVAGVARYLERVRDDPAFESTVVPLGEGFAVSRYAP